MHGPLRVSRLCTFTWRGDSVLVSGFVVAQCEQQHLDGPSKDSSQAQVEYRVEQEDLDCRKKSETFRKMGPIKANSKTELLKMGWGWGKKSQLDKPT